MLLFLAPMPVRNLSLTSTNNSITATWNHSEGNFAWFIVNISSSMSQNIPGPHANTTLLNYTFNSLNTATNYTVTVTTYVKEDLNPSIAVNNSTFTSKWLVLIPSHLNYNSTLYFYFSNFQIKVIINYYILFIF